METARQLLDRWSAAFSTPELNRLDVTLTAEDLTTGVTALSRWGYLATITGLDTGSLELLYHFCHGAAVVTLRVSIPRTDSVLPSICSIVPAASMFEREVSEMLGVTFTNAPNTSRLLLPDDWPSDVYPLRKDALMPAQATE